MSVSVAEAFERARQHNRAAVIAYLPAGFPDQATSIRLIRAMIAEGVIICALWGGAILVAVDGAWVGSYIAANNDRPEGMPSYFADEREKEMYAMKVRRRGAEAPSEAEYVF